YVAEQAEDLVIPDQIQRVLEGPLRIVAVVVGFQDDPGAVDPTASVDVEEAGLGTAIQFRPQGARRALECRRHTQNHIPGSYGRGVQQQQSEADHSEDRSDRFGRAGSGGCSWKAERNHGQLRESMRNRADRTQAMWSIIP